MGEQSRVYLGVDVGGTKIQASLVEESGITLRRRRSPTPRHPDPVPVLEAIERTIQEALKNKAAAPTEKPTAIGLAVPGVVDPGEGRVVVTPNMSLSGTHIGPRLQDKFKLPVVLGNDCNLGTLGEKWLGSARDAQSVMGILVGTGIGGGLVQGSDLWRGARESAGEIGHIVMEIGGPPCSCGGSGCLEALAGRTAIERRIREAVAAGRKTVLSEILQGDLGIIRSGALRRALQQGDELVAEVMRSASEVLGHACLTVRHLLDPEVIVLGGGVIEACSSFVIPIVEEIVAADRLPGAREGGHVMVSSLGDDAVVLGAVAIARLHVGRSPFKKQFITSPGYPKLTLSKSGEITAGDKTFRRDFFITVDGKPKNLKDPFPAPSEDAAQAIGPGDLAGVCKSGPEILFIGTGTSTEIQLTEQARQYLRYRHIECKMSVNAKAVTAYNVCGRRRAALFAVC